MNKSERCLPDSKPKQQNKQQFKNNYNNGKEDYFQDGVGGVVARADCVCMCRVAQTRMRSLVADCGCVILWCFVGWVDDCCGGCDGKEVNVCGLLNFYAVLQQ